MTAHISSCSDASVRSHDGRPRSAGVAVQTCLSIFQGSEIRVLPVASRMFHIPVTDIDVAERIGVLAGAYMIRCKADLILAIIKEERCVLEPSISLYTDRQCLLQTLPRCSAFKVLCDRLINQFGLEQQTGVLLLWERRESNFMQGIDRKSCCRYKNDGVSHEHAVSPGLSHSSYQESHILE